MHFAYVTADVLFGVQSAHSAVQPVTIFGGDFNCTPLDWVQCLKYVMDKLDMVLLMSVNPGFGGQKFIPSTIDKVREVRAMIDASGYDIRLEVDGGISAKNIAEIAAAGADTFVAGQNCLCLSLTEQVSDV